MSLATSYAKALYAAAKDEKVSSTEMDEIEQQLDLFIEVLDGHKEIRQALWAPVLSTKDKVAVIKALTEKAGYSKLVTLFLVLLANKGRLPFFHEVREAFSGVRMEAEGGVLGRVISAEPMAEPELNSLTEAFTRKLGRRVSFRVSTDPTLLAGMKVSVNGTTYDGTLRAKLQLLRERVMTGAPVT